MAHQLPPHAQAPLGSHAWVADLHDQWLRDPESVDPTWQAFFRGFALGAEGGGPAARDQASVDSLMYAYRSVGHFVAATDPLGGGITAYEALELSTFGLSEADLDRTFAAGHLPGPPRRTLRSIIETLRETYCGPIGVEYVHIQQRTHRRWLQDRIEPTRNRPDLTPEQQRATLSHLVDADLFERFTHSRYPGQKRFSLEGGEALVPAIHALLDAAAGHGVAEVVVGMAHRGRLNVLANVVGLSHEMIFSEFEGNFLEDSFQGDGDVKYHRGYSSTLTCAGKPVHVSLTPNPSHLEAVYPVVEGRVRAKQRQRGDVDARTSVLPLVIHGDAAFAGQGVVAETMNLSQVEGYRTGGTVHLVLNNRIGFTTAPFESRSSCYPTDIAKMVEAPIFHVNGDEPEAVVHAVRLALAYRQEFHSDVVVDLVCYRRHGHNEGDDPAFTQPLLYATIRDHPTVAARYAETLRAAGVLSQEELDGITDSFRAVLTDAWQSARTHNPTLQLQGFADLWQGMDGPFRFDPIDTTTPRALIEGVTAALTRVPDGFSPNRKVLRLIDQRRAAVRDDAGIDWALAELLAFGTLLREGNPVRLSGQDSARGTFSQRHAVWIDETSGARHVPLAHVHPDQAHFCIHNSPLSEVAVLGFEFGYAMTEPRMLVMWEAQFGDFVNGAQVMIDQFITGAESKWHRDSGLVLLLPHGYEGQGPEHSNAYLERFLLACAEFNLQVCVPSTPAQHFHLLRRQMRRDIRLPMAIFTPKSLLRHPACSSTVAELADGAFLEFLDDPARPEQVRRLVLCTGKVYYDLAEARDQGRGSDVALVRLEQLHPLHTDALAELLGTYADVDEVVWVQEEPMNRGAWKAISAALQQFFPRHQLGYVGRPASASVATGSLKKHKRDQADLVVRALAETAPAVRLPPIAS